MNAARIGVLVLAIVAAGLAAFLARGLVSSEPEKTAEVVEEPKTEILVAVNDLRVGQRVSGGDLRWQTWPDTALNPAYVRRAQQPTALEDYTDSVARFTLLSGEPVTPEKLVNTANAGFMSALIEPGMRAIALGISSRTSAGGFILPNDRVDIIDEEKGETLLRNVRVLAIDQRFNETGDQVAIGNTATVELTPSQVELISAAQAERTLVLSLRSMGEQELAGTDDNVEGRNSGSVVKIIRYGVAQSVRVK